ncbi:MAG TPA: chemotaxis protein CheW [Longimicrobiales bacterium]|nr:chemotaxis protein CheW [Longimicrobiales bacterium]
MVFRTAIADDAAATAPAVSQWVIFRCSGEQYGVPLSVVSEIVPPRPFTRLPGADSAVCGLVGIRGQVVTVVDLGTLLHGHAAASVPDFRLLLLESGGRTIGAAVDDVVMVAPARAVPGGDSDNRTPGVTGIGRTDDGTFVTLDPAHLLERLLR